MGNQLFHLEALLRHKATFLVKQIISLVCIDDRASFKGGARNLESFQPPSVGYSLAVGEVAQKPLQGDTR